MALIAVCRALNVQYAADCSSNTCRSEHSLVVHGVLLAAPLNASRLRRERRYADSRLVSEKTEGDIYAESLRSHC